MMHKGNTRGGFTTIEVLFATAMLVIVVSSVATFYRKLVDASRATTQQIQSSMLLEEGLEAVKFIRDNGWTTEIASLTSGTTYYLYLNGGAWTTTTTPQEIDGTFARSFIVSDVYRNSTTDDISPSGGGTYLDPGTKKITLSVAWQRKQATGTTTVVAETYMSNILNN